jgi:hypothetical protein
MFDKLMRDLKQLGRGVQIKVALPSDDEGYFDRKCRACQMSGTPINKLNT